MWIASKDGFYSIVDDGRHRGKLVIRSRRVDDLENLRDYVTFGSIDTTSGTDYEARAWALRDDVGTGIKKMINDIDYPNFKNAVVDPLHAEIYHRVWYDLTALGNAT